MNAKLLRQALCIGWAVTVALAVRGAAAQDGPAAGIPELAALSHYVGQWDVEMQINNTTVKGEASGTWILDGHYLEQTATLTATESMPGLKMKTLMTYDPGKKSYLSWTYNSNGNHTEAVATWNASTQVMTSVTRTAEGDRITVTADFSEKNVEKWSIVTSGDSALKITGKNTRRSARMRQQVAVRCEAVKNQDLSATCCGFKTETTCHCATK